MPTELLYLHDATLRSFEATVVEADEAGVALDRTAFYVTGGGQPHDTGILRWEGGEARVVDVGKKGDDAWHTLEGDVPASGTVVNGEIDWDRRWALMRTHTALHVLCGVIWNTWGKAVTGGDMQPLAARMDFEFDPLPPDFGTEVEERVNAELAARRPVEGVIPPAGRSGGRRRPHPHEGQHDPGDRDRDPRRRHRGARQTSRRRHPRGQHGPGRAHPGRQTESKGKGNKRIRIEVVDA